MFLDLLLCESSADNPGWVPGRDGIGRHILSHHSTGRNDGSTPNRDSGKHDHTESNPHIVFDDDALLITPRALEHGGPWRIVGVGIAGKKPTVAGDENVLTDTDVASKFATPADAHVVTYDGAAVRGEESRGSLNVNVFPVANPSIAEMEHVEGSRRISNTPVK